MLLLSLHHYAANWSAEYKPKRNYPLKQFQLAVL